MNQKERRVKLSFVSISRMPTSEVSVGARGRGLVHPQPQHLVIHSHLHISLMFRGETEWMKRCLLNEHFQEGEREKAGKGEVGRDMERGRKRDRGGLNHGETNQTNNVTIMGHKGTIMGHNETMDHKGTIMDHNVTMDNKGTIMDHNVTMDNKGTIMDHKGTMDRKGTLDHNGTMDRKGTLDHNGTMDHKGTIMDHNVTMDNKGTIMDHNVTMDHKGTIMDHKGTITDHEETHGTMLSRMAIILSNTEQTIVKK